MGEGGGERGCEQEMGDRGVEEGGRWMAKRRGWEVEKRRRMAMRDREVGNESGGGLARGDGKGGERV